MAQWNNTRSRWQMDYDRTSLGTWERTRAVPISAVTTEVLTATNLTGGKRMMAMEMMSTWWANAWEKGGKFLEALAGKHAAKELGVKAERWRGEASWGGGRIFGEPTNIKIRTSGQMSRRRPSREKSSCTALFRLTRHDPSSPFSCTL